MAGLIILLGDDQEREVAYCDGDIPVYDCPEVFFSAYFLADPPHWFTVEFPPPPDDIAEGEEVDVTGTLIRMPQLGRVWRLTGEVDDHHGYRGMWPD